LVPEAGPEQLGMQIGASTVTWQSGIPLIFDDCFLHSVWNRTAKERVVLLFDIWWVTVCEYYIPSNNASPCKTDLRCRHPDLHKEEILAIQDMFEDAKQKGWLS